MTIISGDIHHSYLAAVDLPPPAAGAGSPRASLAQGDQPRGGPAAVVASPVVASKVYEAVCSPFHQAMPPKMRIAQGLASSGVSGLIGTAVATLAGARVPRMRWRITDGPWFTNMIATLTYDGPKAVVRFDQAVTDEAGPRLTPVLETDLA